MKRKDTELIYILILLIFIIKFSIEKVLFSVYFCIRDTENPIMKLELWEVEETPVLSGGKCENVLIYLTHLYVSQSKLATEYRSNVITLHCTSNLSVRYRPQ